jgi:alkanesulfonate monooxygenase SsuD/methylene tetrahydromethanopterin reductase-like flavin-dependent oxidoreductase (luciferase family)
MDIAIGMPNAIHDVDGPTFPSWARKAEERGFSSVATIGRLAWPGYDELVVLSAAASVTERIGLLTNVLLAPLYVTAHLAKTTASVDRISRGRLTLGVGVGRRFDDFEVTALGFGDRGKRFDRQLSDLHAAWSGAPIGGSTQPVCPRPARGRVPMLIGGRPELAGPRAALWDAGYTIGGAPPEAAAEMVPAFRAAYERAGGMGRPRIVCLTYFSLGAEHASESLHNLRSYYADLGDWAEGIAQGAARSEGDVHARATAFEQLGADELVLSPTVRDLDQVDRLADVLLSARAEDSEARPATR